MHVAGNIYSSGTLESGNPLFNLSATTVNGYAYGLQSFVSTSGGWARAFRWFNNVNATARQTTFFVGAIGGGTGTSYGYLSIGDGASSDTGYTYTKAIRLYSDGDVTIPDGGLGIGNTNPDAKLHISNAGSIELRLEADTDNSGQEDCFIRFYTDNKTQEGIVGMDNNNSSALFTGNTENAMVFGTVSNLPTIFATNDTERMNIGASGKVGIGTSNGSAALTIRGNSTGTNGFAYPNIEGYTTTTKLYALEQHFGIEGRLALYNDGNLKVLLRGNGESYIDNGANFGIGNSSPQGKLDVDGAIYVGAGTTNTIDLSTHAANNSHYGICGPQGYWGVRTATNQSFNIDVYNSNSSINAFTILQDGKVGIGSTNPANLLQVGSHVHVTTAGLIGIGLAAPEVDLHISNSSPAIRFTDENVSNLKHTILGGGDAGLEYSADMNNVAAGYHRWDISGAEKMRLKENGYLGIGQSNPSAKLHVYGGDYNTGMILQASSNAIGITFMGSDLSLIHI